MATNNNVNGSSKLTIFTSSGTWNKDPRTSLVHIFLIGAASGGGSGRQGLTTLAGGGSGSTGSSNGHYISIGAYYDNSISVTIGSGGAGGISQSSISSDGNLGSLAGDVLFGTQFGISAISSNQGKAGSTTTVTGGLSNLRFCNIGGQTINSQGGSGTITAGTSVSDAIGFSMLSTGGGGGGGADSTTARSGGNGGNIVNRALSAVTILSGGPGGIETGTINGTNGNSATQPQNAVASFATGGGGGGGQKTGLVAGNGGNGGIPGGGAGGGGGSINGTSSGAGGNGARGEIWVMEIF